MHKDALNNKTGKKNGMTEHDGDNAIIRMFHVYKRYGSKNALVDISFDVQENELLLVTGPSGAGKSTLLKLLYFGEPVSEGQILIEGINLSRISHKRIPFLRRRFGIIFQDYKLIPTKTVFENIAMVLEVTGGSFRFIQKKVSSVLRTVGMEEKLNAYPPSLSGGEQQRVAVARAVVGDPKIILADEPTGSLDSESASIIMGLLRGFQDRGTTVIIATHDTDIINRARGRALHLIEGHMQPEGVKPKKKRPITI